MKYLNWTDVKDLTVSIIVLFATGFWDNSIEKWALILVVVPCTIIWGVSVYPLLKHCQDSYLRPVFIKFMSEGEEYRGLIEPKYPLLRKILACLGTIFVMISSIFITLGMVTAMFGSVGQLISGGYENTKLWQLAMVGLAWFSVGFFGTFYGVLLQLNRLCKRDGVKPWPLEYNLYIKPALNYMIIGPFSLINILIEAVLWTKLKYQLKRAKTNV